VLPDLLAPRVGVVLRVLKVSKVTRATEVRLDPLALSAPQAPEARRARLDVTATPVRQALAVPPV